MDPLEIGDAAVGQPLGPGLLGAAGAEGADVADAALEGGGQHRPGQLEVVGHDHQLVHGRHRGDEAGRRAGVVDRPDLPAEERRRGLEGIGVRSPAHDDQLGHREEDGQHPVVGDVGGAGPSLEGLGHGLVLGAGVGREELGAQDPVVVEPGEQGDRLAVQQAVPEVVWELVGGHHQATGRPPGRQADHRGLEVGHLQ